MLCLVLGSDLGGKTKARTWIHWMILRISTDDKESISCLSKKFGAPIEMCERLLKVAKSLNLLVTGVSFHIGSGSSNPQSFHQAIADARHLFEIGNKLGHQMRVLDIGGGFPGYPDFQPKFEEFAAVIVESLNQYFPSTEDVEVIAEPGRYYVSSAFVLATNIIAKKKNYVKGADGKVSRQLAYYLNEGLFGSFMNFKLCKEDKSLKLTLEKCLVVTLTGKVDSNGEHEDSRLERLKDGSVTLVEEGVSALQFIKKRIRGLSLNGDEDAFYVADLNDVIRKHRRFRQQLPRVRPFYAVKCNSSIEVLQVLAALGTGFDCASKGEIQIILGMGVPAADIVYANPCKQPSHIRYAAKHGVNKMTFDCESELMKISDNHPTAEMILRISTDDKESISCLSKKFGAPIEMSEHLLKVAKSLNLLVTGVSFHIGSGSSNPQSFHQAIADARHLFEIGNKLGHQMRVLDIGGGFPGHQDFQPKFEEFAAVIVESLNQYFPSTEDVEVIAEPGRYYVCSAFALAANIITKKENYVKGADGKVSRQLAYYLNEGLFGSFMIFTLFKEDKSLKLTLEKDILPSAERFPSKLWGQCCTEKDVILEEVDLPELEVGDWIIFQNMGAYCMALTTTFNGFLPPPVHYILRKDKWKIFENQLN